MLVMVQIFNNISPLKPIDKLQFLIEMMKIAFLFEKLMQL